MTELGAIGKGTADVIQPSGQRAELSSEIAGPHSQTSSNRCYPQEACPDRTGDQLPACAEKGPTP